MVDPPRKKSMAEIIEKNAILALVCVVGVGLGFGISGVLADAAPPQLAVLAGMAGLFGGLAGGFVLSAFGMPKATRRLVAALRRGGTYILSTSERENAQIWPVKNPQSDFILSTDGKLRWQKLSRPLRLGKASLYLGHEAFGATLDPSAAVAAGALWRKAQEVGISAEDPRAVVPADSLIPEGDGEGVAMLKTEPSEEGNGDGRPDYLFACKAQAPNMTTYDLHDLLRFTMNNVPAVDLQRHAVLSEVAARQGMMQGKSWMPYLVAVFVFLIVAYVAVKLFSGEVPHLPPGLGGGAPVSVTQR